MPGTMTKREPCPASNSPAHLTLRHDKGKVALSSSAYKYPRRGGDWNIRGLAEKKKKGSQNGGIEGEKGELEGFFLKEKVRETERERPTVFLERKRGETEREKEQGFLREGSEEKQTETLEIRGEKRKGRETERGDSFWKRKGSHQRRQRRERGVTEKKYIPEKKSNRSCHWASQPLPPS